MNTNTESDSDTEEIIVFAEFKDNVNIDKYSSVHVLGIDTKNPVFQLDDTFFVGKYENPLGTFMFFDQDPSPHCEDPLYDKLPDKNLKYLLKTRKCLTLQHGYITPKEGTEGQQKNAETVKQPQDDNIKLIKFKSVQDALEKFKQEWSTNDDT